MPKVNLGGIDHEKIFGSKLKAMLIEKQMECRQVAKKLGCSDGTLSSRFKNPSKMPLGELKLFIKISGLPPETVIQYLYEKNP